MVGTASETINEQVGNTTAKREARMARFMVAKVELNRKAAFRCRKAAMLGGKSAYLAAVVRARVAPEFIAAGNIFLI